MRQVVNWDVARRQPTAAKTRRSNHDRAGITDRRSQAVLRHRRSPSSCHPPATARQTTLSVCSFCEISLDTPTDMDVMRLGGRRGRDITIVQIESSETECPLCMSRRSTPSRTSAPARSLSETRWVPQRVHRMIELAISARILVSPHPADEQDPYLSSRRRWANLGIAREDSLRGAEYRPPLVRPPKSGEEQSSGVRRELPASQV